MPSENEGVEEREKQLAIKLTAKAALLDFYSDRAVAHASLFVASIFGLVTVLAIIQNIECNVLLLPLSLLLYWAFAYAGYFTFQRFSYYADISDRLRQDIDKEAKIDSIEIYTESRGKKLRKTNFDQYLKEEIEKQRQFFGKGFLKKRYLFAFDEEGKPKIVIKLFDPLYWVLIGLLALLVYLPLIQYRILSIASLSASLIIIFVHDELKGWFRTHRKYKRFIRIMFIVVFAIFVISNV